MSLTLADIKQHLRVDEDDTAEDGNIAHYFAAAKLAVQNSIDRKIYEENEVIPDADEWGIKIDEALEQAIKLTTGHFYEHRESVVVGATVAELPLAYDSLIQPYRKMGV